MPRQVRSSVQADSWNLSLLTGLAFMGLYLGVEVGQEAATVGVE
jgi:hypothetical protein